MLLIMAILFSIVLLFTGCVIKKSVEQDIEMEKTCEKTYAVIERVIQSDMSSIWYYVSFMKNGEKITAQTGDYSLKTEALKTGETVYAGYYVTPKGVLRAVILDNRIIPAYRELTNTYRFFFIAGAIGIILSLL